MANKNIIAKCNLDTGTWTIDKSLLRHIENQIAIGFNNNSNTTVVFDNLSFLFKITDLSDNSVVKTKSYPPSGITYVETNDEFIITESNLNLKPGSEYSLYVEVTNNGSTYTETTQLDIPYPVKPHTSWTWDATNEYYVSPTPYPSNTDYLWDWDETNSKWVKRSGEMLRGPFMKRLNDTSLNDSTTALSKSESMFQNDDYSTDARIVWQYYTVFVRTDKLFNIWANEVGLTESQLNTIFA
jgi:hypothetical protein